MTVRVDLAEYLTAYIAEVDEQLASANSKLLAIDAAARKGERQPRAVRDLFRAMHTIKGLSAMVDIEPIVTISHRLETVLRDADRCGGQLAVDVVDLVLRGARAIEASLRAVERGAPPLEPPRSLLAELDAVAPQEAVPSPPAAARLALDPALEQKLDGFERELLIKGASEGRRALRLDYVPTAARSAEGLNINVVRERLGAIAEIIRVIPISLPGLPDAPGGIAFALLLLTSQSDEQLGAAAGVDPASIQRVVEPETASPPASLAPLAGDLLAEAGPRSEDEPRRNLLRVDAARVDEAMEQLGALLVTRSRLARAISKLAASGADTREIVQVAGENARQLRDLRSSILQVRMVPLTELLDRIPLMLRALMRSSGRQVRLETEARGAELDKAVAERLFPALIHLMRNAVDHGLESAEARMAAGKPADGLLRITGSSRSSTRLQVVVEDDGRGVDAALVAKRLGVQPPDSDAALLELLCQPGFSTRETATTTSGRGLGMDIVKRIVVDELGGELSMRTALGAGTVFTLQIPLTVAIVDGFVVECAEQRFVVPVSIVEEIMEVDPDSLIAPPHGEGRDAAWRPAGMVERRGETLPFYVLSAMLGLRAERAAERRALVIRRAGEPVGFLLSRVTGQQEAVIRPLRDPLVRVPGISASTDLGDGRPTLVLDLTALAGQGRGRGKALLPAAPRALLDRPSPGVDESA